MAGGEPSPLSSPLHFTEGVPELEFLQVGPDLAPE